MTFESIDLVAAGASTLAAIGLLGSPGPAIAALLAVGKIHGPKGGLRFYGGLQIGLASAAAISVVGFVSLVVAVPATRIAMIVVATAYLLYLAFKIATAPVGADTERTRSGRIVWRQRVASCWPRRSWGSLIPKPMSHSHP